MRVLNVNRIFEIKATPINYNSQAATLIYLRETTEIVRAIMQKTQDKLTSMYSANVSHEMRTPLSTSINFTDLLLSTERDESKRKQLEIIRFSSVMMLNSVNDTLDYAQI